MVDLLPGQFELNGYVFGRADDPVTVLTGGWGRDTYDVRAQDVANPVGDTMLFGRDRLTPARWPFQLMAHVDEGSNVRPVQAALAAAWRNDSGRATPGRASVLRFNQDGVTYRVLGRPRELSWVGEDVHDPSMRLAAASFQLSDINVYADETQSISLSLVSTSTSTGMVLPFVLPAVLGETSAFQRRGIVSVGGTVPTPLLVTITGPTSGQANNVMLSTSSWKIALTAPVFPNQKIVIDTGAGTMERDGAPYAGITRDSSLFLRVPPGNTEMNLTASDSSSSLQASASWRAADPLI